MADVFSKAKRSEVMSRIHGRGNKNTELVLATLLRRHRISGWRRNQLVFGKPDFIFPAAKLAVFVDGCFWHGCPKHATNPKSNRSFWANKLGRNKARDLVVTRKLRKQRWRVVRIWEHDLRRAEQCISRIRRALELKGK